MLNIGCHLSVSKGYEAIGKDALKIGANTFQFFTRNPRGSKAKEIDIICHSFKRQQKSNRKPQGPP